MPSVTIPFIGSFTRPVVPKLSLVDGGSILTKGQKFTNCVFTRNINEATQSQTVAIEKRPGLRKSTTYGAGTDTFTALTAPSFNNSSYFGAYGSTNSVIVGNVAVTNSFATFGGRSLGTVTGVVRSISESNYSGVGTIAMVSSDGTGWYCAMDAGTGSPTFSATTTNGSPTLTAVSSFSGLYVGQAISGTGIPAGARIQSLNPGASTLVMGTDSATSVNATASGGITVTRTPIAKIIDVDFPSVVGAFVFVDGYAFVMTASGRVYGSDLNSIASWSASNYITANLSNDGGVSLARYKNNILAFGVDSCEPFYNAGNPSGSVLARSDQNFFKVGAFGANSIVNVEDTIYWLGVSGSKGAAVYRLDGYTPVKVSTAEIESLLTILTGSITTGEFLYLGAASVCGSINLFLTNISRYVETGITSSIQSLLYDVTLKIWHGWGAGIGVGTDYQYGSFHLPAYVSYYNQVVFGGIGTGTIYRLWPSEVSYFRDNTTDGADGSAYNMIVSTRKVNFGTNNRKTIKRITLNCDRHSSGSVSVRYLDDDSLNISQTTSLGSFDISAANPQIHRGGSFVGGRIWSFTHSEAEDFRMESVTFDYEVGKH